MARRGGARIGCSGWSYEGWRHGPDPEGLAPRDRLAWYAERFATVELNTTFSRLPAESTVQPWARPRPRRGSPTR